jgi:hypothetical protein
MKKTLTAAALLAISGVTIAQQQYSAKSLFFGEDGTVQSASTSQKNQATPVVQAKNEAKPKQKKTPVASKQIGASYFIRLKGTDGSARDVLASHTFKSGDRFQLGVKVNRPSYVYVLNQDPDGNLSQIFPMPGQDNYVNAMGMVFLPSRGAFEFDAKPGVEQLMVFLSPTPMNSVAELAGRSKPDVVTGAADVAVAGTCAVRPEQLAAQPAPGRELDGAAFAAKGIAFKDDPACVAPAPAFASKAIVFSDDPEPGQGGQVASYVVKKIKDKADKNLFMKIKLAHE